MTAKARITEQALLLLEAHPEGQRHSVLIKSIWKSLSDIPKGTVVNAVIGLVVNNPDTIYKPAKGLFRLTKYRDEPDTPPITAPANPAASTIRESDFYSAFAQYLTDDLEECTRAVPLGGAGFRDKWGTPDVMGIREARPSDIVKFQTEIVSAEIKIDGNSLITAFGQAVAYKLFSHKSYIVVPRESLPEDLDRLESLCLTCGLGLILFDHQTVETPNFAIRVRAQKSEPDTFYVNRNLKLIEHLLFT
jgi:hypothetical protein